MRSATCSLRCWFTEGFEPRHQRGVKARRNCLWWNAGGGLLPPAFRLCFQHRLGLFLHEQGDSVRALNYVMPKARRDGLVTDDVLRDVAMQFTALRVKCCQRDACGICYDHIDWDAHQLRSERR